MLRLTIFINFSPPVTMESFTLNHFILRISLQLLLFSLSIFNLSVPTAAESLACAVVDCGEGTCKDSNSSVLGFECECDPGWKKIQIGPLTFPSCVLPNCSVDLQCNNASSPALSLPQMNGTCVANGNGYKCQCSQGAANLFNNPAWGCFDECSLGFDCNELGLGLGIPNPPPPPPLPFAESGPVTASNCATNLRALTMMLLLLATTFLAWF
ncbi:uncharacterized protein LOC123212200 isoform X2 [Mangifera indica]|uniref:uncharacterized protein LOC123212200 isoform X2 n=1 Tax=Mangifera indica TaxID=29780 RepID=UPI001CFB4A2F|nr:uncharacterized protein LOC123212200 isoform X2 [Mangifera indica]